MGTIISTGKADYFLDGVVIRKEDVPFFDPEDEEDVFDELGCIRLDDCEPPPEGSHVIIKL